MEISIKELTLDLSDYGIHKDTITAMQMDNNTRFIKAKILNNGLPANLDGMFPVLRGTKPDGKTIFDNCTKENNFVIIELTTQILLVAGIGNYELAFYDSIPSPGQTEANMIAAFPFHIHVIPSNFDATSMVSSDEFIALREAMTNIPMLDDLPDYCNSVTAIRNQIGNHVLEQDVTIDKVLLTQSQVDQFSHVESSEINGNINLDGSELEVYDDSSLVSDVNHLNEITSIEVISFDNKNIKVKALADNAQFKELKFTTLPKQDPLSTPTMPISGNTNMVKLYQFGHTTFTDNPETQLKALIYEITGHQFVMNLSYYGILYNRVVVHHSNVFFIAINTDNGESNKEDLLLFIYPTADDDENVNITYWYEYDNNNNRTLNIIPDINCFVTKVGLSNGNWGVYNYGEGIGAGNTYTLNCYGDRESIGCYNYEYKIHELWFPESIEDQVVYGAAMNLYTKDMYRTWDYISNYDGSPLPGVWMSDQAIYAEGTLPPVGSEVAYKLSTASQIGKLNIAFDYSLFTKYVGTFSGYVVSKTTDVNYSSLLDVNHMIEDMMRYTNKIYFEYTVSNSAEYLHFFYCMFHDDAVLTLGSDGETIFESHNYPIYHYCYAKGSTAWQPYNEGSYTHLVNNDGTFYMNDNSYGSTYTTAGKLFNYTVPDDHYIEMVIGENFFSTTADKIKATFQTGLFPTYDEMYRTHNELKDQLMDYTDSCINELRNELQGMTVSALFGYY